MASTAGSARNCRRPIRYHDAIGGRTNVWISWPIREATETEVPYPGSRVHEDRTLHAEGAASPTDTGHRNSSQIIGRNLRSSCGVSFARTALRYQLPI